MPEEKTENPNTVSTEQFNELQTKYHQLEKSGRNKFRSGLLTGGAVAGIIAVLLYHDCRGNSVRDYQKNADDGVCDSDISNTDSGLTEKLRICYDDLNKCNNQLELCLEDHTELSKRPKNCSAYKPKACPPAALTECQSWPYTRKGD